MATTAVTPSAPVSAPVSSPAPASAPATGGAHSSAPPPVDKSTFAGKSLQEIYADRFAQFPDPEQVAAEGEAAPVEVDASEVVDEDVDSQPETDLQDQSEEEPFEFHDETGEDEFRFELEPEKNVAPRELASAISSDPAVKAALESNPALRNQIFANARLAARAQEYEQHFANPGEAQAASQNSQVYTGVRDVLAGLKPQMEQGGPESTQAALQALFQATVLRGDDGQPVLDAQGQPITDGSIGRLLTNAMQARLMGEIQKAVANGDVETQAAFDIAMERLGWAPSRPGEGEENEELARNRAAFEQERQSFRQEQQQQKQAAKQSFETRVETAANQKVDTAINSVLERAEGLSAFSKEALDDRLRKGLRAAIRKDPMFGVEYNNLNSRTLTPQLEKDRVALVGRYLNKHLGAVARPLLEQAGITQLAQQGKKQATSAARQTAAQSEVRGAAKTGHTTSAMTPVQLKARAEQELTAKLGRRPNVYELTSRMSELRA